MARHDALYRRAIYYDIAMERDVDREVDFTLEAFRLHGGKNAESILEIGCGPGYHARTLARRGVSVSALDVSEAMIMLAREKSAEDGVSVRWIEADMTSFELDEPVDMAVCYFDGIDALLTERDLEDHFEAVASALKDGGLYLIDCTHPRDCSLSDYGRYSYMGERNGTHVEILWGTNRPRIDPVTGIAEVATRMIVSSNGQSETIDDVARERCFSAQELRLLAERNNRFRIAEWYGDFSLDQPLDNSDRSRRMIAIFRKNKI